MFFVVRSNGSFNFPLGLIKHIGTVIVICSVISFDSGKPRKEHPQEFLRVDTKH